MTMRLGEWVGVFPLAVQSAPTEVAFPKVVHNLVPALTLSTGPSVTRKYKMRGRDDGVPSPGYVTWVSTSSPDFAGAGFGGGTPTPVGSFIPGSAVVEDEWEE